MKIKIIDKDNVKRSKRRSPSQHPKLWKIEFIAPLSASAEKTKTILVQKRKYFIDAVKEHQEHLRYKDFYIWCQKCWIWQIAEEY